LAKRAPAGKSLRRSALISASSTVQLSAFAVDELVGSFLVALDSTYGWVVKVGAMM